MNSKQYEQRLKSFKQQKYDLLILKQQLIETAPQSVRHIELLNAVDETLVLIDHGMKAAMRIVEYMRGIESEMNGYLIIEKKLQDVMFDYDLTEASAKLAINKLNNVGEHLEHLEQLIKYKG